MPDEVEVIEARPSTFMSAVYSGARDAAYGVNANELAGVSKEQFVAAVRAVTDALDTMPGETSIHAALYAVTYVRNSLILLLRDGQAKMESVTGLNG